MEDLLLTTLVFWAVLFASIGLWSQLTRRLQAGQPILPYEPRRPVPWGPGLGLAAAFFVGMTILSALVGGRETSPAAMPTSGEFVSMAMMDSAIKLALVLLGVLVIVVVSSGSRLDLGLPASGLQLGRDLGLGLVTALATLAPVYFVQFTLVQLVGWEPHHPALEQLMHQPTIGVALAAFFAAAVVAPIFEEFVFRLLMQGWLEKVEDRYLGLPDHGPAPGETRPTPTLPVDSAETNPFASSGVVERESGEASPVPSYEGGFDLPRGWSPLITTSVCFGLAHYTQGPAPLSLILFAIVVGYVYQRTHRIVPCVTAHATFNAYSLMLVWMSAA